LSVDLNLVGQQVGICKPELKRSAWPGKIWTINFFVHAHNLPEWRWLAQSALNWACSHQFAALLRRAEFGCVAGVNCNINGNIYFIGLKRTKSNKLKITPLRKRTPSITIVTY
jgi:hypothetical protein